MTHPLRLNDGVVVRPLTSGDAVALVPLNDAAAPAVPITSATELARLIELSSLALAVQRGDAVVGFILAMSPGTAYDSENYQFFESRATDYLYVDRIVIDEHERGSGLGAVLYQAVFDDARRHGRAEVTCEVNVDPPNPRSMSFHERLGFVRVATQSTKAGTVTVALLAATVTSDSSA